MTAFPPVPSPERLVVNIFFSSTALAFLFSASDGGPVPVYTNVDLARVAPFRDETGVNSPPARGATPAAHSEGASREARGEEYWRREADRLRDRLQPLTERKSDLRRKIAQRQSAPGVLPYSDPQVLALQRALQTLEQKARDLESRLEERARRAGALPGWLR